MYNTDNTVCLVTFFKVLKLDIYLLYFNVTKKKFKFDVLNLIYNLFYNTTFEIGIQIFNETFYIYSFICGYNI